MGKGAKLRLLEHLSIHPTPSPQFFPFTFNLGYG